MRGFQSPLVEETLYVDSFLMHFFHWTPSFRSEMESSIVPILASFPNLPLFFFNKLCLFSTGRMIGIPLTIDMPTVELSRPSVAKICMQLDLLKKLPSRVWLECGNSLHGFWQPFEYERVPKYCKHCFRLGHDVHSRKITHPQGS